MILLVLKIRSILATLKQSVKASLEVLLDKLPQLQEKLALRIMDDLTMMASEGSLDSFLCGFKLA